MSSKTKKADGPVPVPVVSQELIRRVETVCGGRICLHPTTPRLEVQGRSFYFCLPACKEIFERSPRTSCLRFRQ